MKLQPIMPTKMTLIIIFYIYNTVAYTDDRYVYKVSAIKKYDTEDYIEINIKELE